MVDDTLFAEFLELNNGANTQGVALNKTIGNLLRDNKYLDVKTSNNLIRQTVSQLNPLSSPGVLTNSLKYVLNHPDKGELIKHLSDFQNYEFWDQLRHNLEVKNDSVLLQQIYTLLLPQNISSKNVTRTGLFISRHRFSDEMLVNWLEGQERVGSKWTNMTVRTILADVYPFSSTLFDGFINLLYKNIITSDTLKTSIIACLLTYAQGDLERVKKIVPFVNFNTLPHDEIEALKTMQLSTPIVDILIEQNAAIGDYLLQNNNIDIKDYNRLLLSAINNPKVSSGVFASIEPKVNILPTSTIMALYQHFLQYNNAYPDRERDTIGLLVEKLAKNNTNFTKIFNSVDMIAKKHFKETVLKRLLQAKIEDSVLSYKILKKLDSVNPSFIRYNCAFITNRSNTKKQKPHYTYEWGQFYKYYFIPQKEMLNFMLPKLDKENLSSSIANINFNDISIDNLQYLWKIKDVRDKCWDVFFQHSFVNDILTKKGIQFTVFSPNSQQSTAFKMKMLKSIFKDLETGNRIGL